MPRRSCRRQMPNGTSCCAGCQECFASTETKRPSSASTRLQLWNKLSSLITAIINAVKSNNLNTFISIYHPEATTSAKIERATLLAAAFQTGLSSSSEIETGALLCSARLLVSMGGWIWFRFRKGKKIADQTGSRPRKRGEGSK